MADTPFDLNQTLQGMFAPPPDAQSLPPLPGPDLSWQEKLGFLLPALTGNPFLAGASALDSISKSSNETNPQYQAALQQYGPALQGTVSPQVKAARAAALAQAKEALSQQKGSLLNTRINGRNTLYHVTDPDKLADILSQGIKVSKGYTPSNSSLIPDYPKGTSLTRLADIPTKSGSASLVIDPTKIPKNVPLAEAAWRKTEPGSEGPGAWPAFPGATANFRQMNPLFEAEQRTLGKAVPPEAIIRVLLSGENPAALQHYASKVPANIPVEYVDPRLRALDRVRQLLAQSPQKNVP